MSVEAPLRPQKTVIYYNGHGECPRREGKPTVFSSLQALDASEQLRQGKAEVVVFSTGPLLPGETPIAEELATQVRRNLPGLPEEKIIVLNGKTNTRDEIEQFKRLAQQNCWDNLEVRTLDMHRKRVERTVKRKFGRMAKNIPVVSTESKLTETVRTILKNNPDGSVSIRPRQIDMAYRLIVEKVMATPQYNASRDREKFLNLIDMLPFGGQLLDMVDSLLKGNKKLEILFHELLVFKQRVLNTK